jgi:hypothetical protein
VLDTNINPKGMGKLMLNIFEVLKNYAGNWNLVETRSFTSEEIANIASAEVVPSQYGNSVKFIRTEGSIVFIPLSTESTLVVGSDFDVTTGKLLRLSKPGEDDIWRVLE